MAVVEVSGEQYHVEDRLKKAWDNIKDGKIVKMDEDRVYVVDGREGSGKSLFTFQQAAYIDPTIIENGMPRITFSAEDTLKMIRQTKSTTKETKAIIFDEAFRGLSSRAALSKTNKQIIQALMEMRQNNLVLFIVLPSFFMLDIYPALSRSTALIHINKKKGKNQRAFYVYNYAKKAKLYNMGLKKGWKYGVFTQHKGRFSNKFPGGQEHREIYLKKKEKSFLEHDVTVEKVDKNLQDRNLLVYNAYKRNNSLRKTAEEMKAAGVQLGYVQIGHIVKKIAGKQENPV